MDNLQEKVVEVNEEVIQEQPKKAKKTSLIVLGVIALIFYLAVTIFGLILLIDVLNSETDLERGIGLVVVIILVIGYGSLAYLVPIGVSIAGLIVSIKKKKRYGLSKLWIIGFAIMIVLPIITEIAILVLIKIVA